MVVRYSIFKLVLYILLSLAILLLGLWATDSYDFVIAVSGWITAALGAAGLVVFPLYLMTDRVILEFDSRGLRYKKFFSSQYADWRDLREFEIETDTTNFIATTRHLNITIERRGLKVWSINENLLDRSSGKIDHILERMEQVMSEAERGSRQRSVATPATRAAPQPTAAAPAGAHFGRKGF